MEKRTTLTAEGTPVAANVRNSSTGTVHASIHAGEAVCPTRMTSTTETTDAPVTCKTCLKLQFIWDNKSPELFNQNAAPAQDSVTPAAPVEPSAPAPANPLQPGAYITAPPSYAVRFTRKTRTGLDTEVNTFACLSWEHAGQELEAAQAIQEREGVSGDAVILIDGKAAPTRTYWQTGPCPPWCVGPHRDSDDPTEREHQSLYLSTPLTESKPAQYGPNLTGETYTWQAPPLMTCLIQHVRYTKPNIEMCVGDGEVSATLTLDEAEQHAANLAELVKQGRGVPPVHAPAEGCVPWCVRHTSVDTCWGEQLEGASGYTSVELSYTAGDGARVYVSGEEEMTVEQAEELAHLILKQTARARGMAAST